MMDTTLFRKKYLGEVTLKTGEHVKFLFPVPKSNLDYAKLEAKTIWRQIHNKKINSNKTNIREYQWAIIDDLDLHQFQTAYVGTKVYGKNYWKFVWARYLEKNS